MIFNFLQFVAYSYLLIRFYKYALANNGYKIIDTTRFEYDMNMQRWKIEAETEKRIKDSKTWYSDASSIYEYFMKNNKDKDKVMYYHKEEFYGGAFMILAKIGYSEEYFNIVVKHNKIKEIIHNYTDCNNERIALYLRYRFMKYDEQKLKDFEALSEPKEIIEFIISN